MTVGARHLNVFVNVPFDNEYEPLFEALIFAIIACGYRARCALEDSDSGDIRFELGLALGAKRFGRRQADRLKVMVDKAYQLPAYLSDLGGNDPDAHGDEPRNVIRIVRNFLQRSPRGEPLPGPAKLARDFQRFKARLPAIAATIGFLPEEVSGYGDYPTFAWCVNTFLTETGPDADE